MYCKLITSFLILVSIAAQGPAQRKYKLHSFEKTQLDKDFHCEGASFGDLNRDGKPDLISGPFWYEGPAFENRHEFYKPHKFDVKRYSDNFFVFVHDFNADDWNDILVIGFPGKDASWFQNPKGAEGIWKRHIVFAQVDNESPTFTDLTGDGKPELVCQTKGEMGYATPDWSQPEKPWPFHPITPKGKKIGGRFTHGLGVGDINGDGRNDIMWMLGWFEQPASLEGNPEWKVHLHNFAGRGGAQMYAYDVDGDGDNDVISSHNAHGYGLYWFEQVAKEGKLTFVRHRIMGNLTKHSRYGVVFGNIHAIDLIDMDRDGLKDIVTGNRYWAHGGNAKADRQNAPVYWFKLVRAAKGKGAHFVPHLVDEHSGVGTQVVAGDMNGDGYPDVIVGNKMGTFIHHQKVSRVKRAEWMKSRREFLKDSAAQLDAATIDRSKGYPPKGKDGKPLNMNFETGDLRNWTATGTAFNGLPVKGDTVRARRKDYRSNHAGQYWIGTYELNNSDKSKGTLTSDPFVVTDRYVSFLVAGGQDRRTRVELVLAGSKKVIHTVSGKNGESLTPESADLKKYLNKEIFVRLVDDYLGHWGHINFDDLLLHKEDPWGKNGEPSKSRKKQTEGYSPVDAAKRMGVPEGFKVELVAGEPDVHQPIGFCIDERGRLWVAEAHSYPKRRKGDKAKDKILVFEDTDADGSFDKRTVFVDDLNLISGLEVGFGGVWVGAAPYFMFIPDKDGDLKPDSEPEILLDGWGYQDTHETLNAFVWGPDGWLYGCHGVFTHSKVGKPGTKDEDRTKVNAAVWRYHPKRHEFDIFARGASNQWGVDFNDHGQCFITACVIPHLYHVIQGARYHRQGGKHFNSHVYDDIKTIADHLHYLGSRPHAGNGVSNSVGGGHAHCGAMIYLGDSFPDQYRNTIFMHNVHGNRINTDILTRDGSGYVGSHGPDFLLANDKWFRGINMRYGPDGNVFLIDWYDEQACHLKNPEVWDRTNGRIYKVSYGDRGAVMADLSAKSNLDLVAMQLHKNDWYVRNARRVLQERGGNPRIWKGLLTILQEQDDVTRQLRALWALHVTGGLTETLAAQLLKSDEEYLRAWTVQLTTEDEKVSDAIADRMVAMAKSDKSQVVRLYLASAMQRVPDALRWRLGMELVAHVEDEGDHNLPLMVWYGIEALVAEDPKRALSLLARSKLSRVTQFLCRRLANAGDIGLDSLITVLGESKAEEAIAVALKEMAETLAKRDTVEMPKGWSGLYPRLAKIDRKGVRENAQTVAVVFGDQQVLPEIRGVLADRDVKMERRQWALDNLLRVKDLELVMVLQGLLDDPKMAVKAIRGLSRFDDAKTPGVLLARFGKMSQAQRTATVTTLTSRVSYTKQLLGAVVDKTVPKSVLDSAATRRQIRGFKDEGVDKLMVDAWGQFRRIGADKKKFIDEWKKKITDDVLAKADLSAGRAVFAKTCMVCHKLFGQGPVIGPDITGSNRDNLDYILGNIIDPSGEVAKEYMLTSVETKDGGFFGGMIVDDNDATITLRDVAGERQQIARKDIATGEDGKLAITTMPISLMPEGQLLGLTETEVQNLIAYLGADLQVDMTATHGSLPTFFNMRDLTNWDADPKVWSVEDGEIVGRSKVGLKRNNFAKSHMVFGDFRLIVDVKLTDNVGNSGIQFRSQRDGKHLMKGYQADMGKGWWGKLYEEHLRKKLWDKNRDHAVKNGEWNTYEILAVGSKIRTALNGVLCVDMDDPKGARKGIFGLQVHSGGPTEVRFRNFRLELNPKFELKTKKK